MAISVSTITDLCREAKTAARTLGLLDAEAKNAALTAIAVGIEASVDEILSANTRDLEAGRESGLDLALLDRLMLDEGRLRGIAGDVRRIVELPDPVGRLIEEFTLPNGLEVRKVAVPLGVIAVVYEARPNVTIDAAALCLKSGNAVVLRGSSIATHSNAVLAKVATTAVESAGLPRAAISLVAGGGRDELAELATRDGLVDLIIPRGGAGLKAALQQHATVPVIYAAAGNCHVYVDASADLEMALAITLNAKTQRPGVCNSLETLLVHSEAAPAFVPLVAQALLDAGVELRTDAKIKSLAGPLGSRLVAAIEDDWATEYLDLTLAVKLVESVDEAIDHVNRYGTGHSEAIITGSSTAAHRFTTEVDAACVYVNASTRFTDGGEFGMGAEIGNSTQKLHVRGPIGLRELCSYKYVVDGAGQVRS